jgi:hypothetical protein
MTHTVMPGEGPASTSLLLLKRKDVDGGPSPAMTIRVMLTATWY